MKNNTKYQIEYRIIRSIGKVMQSLPYKGSLFNAWLLAKGFYGIMTGRVKEAKQRISAVFPEMPPDKVSEVAWLSCRNIFFSGAEMLRMPYATKDWLASITDCHEMIETLKMHTNSGKGAIIACPHMGSWELAAATCSMHGLPLFSIAAKQRNPLIDQYINELRTSPGIPTVERGAGTMKQVLTRLKNGEILAILPDVRMKTPALSIPFLGGTANIGSGMALFARHANVPVFPCIVSRIGWTRHKIQIHKSIFPDINIEKSKDVEKITRLVLGIMDQAIRNSPEQWFWYNKRWILEPILEK